MCVCFQKFTIHSFYHNISREKQEKIICSVLFTVVVTLTLKLVVCCLYVWAYTGQFFLSNYSVLHKDFDYSVNSTTYISNLNIKDRTPFETITNFKMFKVFHFSLILFDIILHRTVLVIQVTKARDLCLQNAVTKNVSALVEQEYSPYRALHNF